MKNHIVLAALILALVAVMGACSKNTLSPSQPIALSVPTSTYTPSPIPGSPTSTPVFSYTPTYTFTITLTDTPGSPTSTPTPTLTPTRTLTPDPTAGNTNTPCWTVTWTVTSTVTRTPGYYISGQVAYNGSGTVDSQHRVYVGALNTWNSGATASPGTYLLGAWSTGVYDLSAFYNSAGVTDINQAYWAIHAVPGLRYMSSGSCSFPAAYQTVPVTVSGSIGTTVTGPNLTADDGCSYEGVYGTLTYNGNLGAPGYCRRLYVEVFSDAARTANLNYGLNNPLNGKHYFFLTNDSSGHTGLAPVYLRAWYDADGANGFSTGDPYLEVGPVFPSDNGTLQDLTLDDSQRK